MWLISLALRTIGDGEHGLAHVSVVYGQASREKFKGMWSGWSRMLFSVEEIVCHGNVEMQLESNDNHREQ